MSPATGTSRERLGAPSPSRPPARRHFCYQDGARQYCFDIDGTLRYLDTAAGSTVQVDELTKTTAYENGMEVGSAVSASMSRSVFEADGSVVIDSVVHTHSTLGDEPCQYRLVLRLVDYEAVVYQTESTCGA